MLCDFIKKLDYPQKVGVITGTGDRRDDDIKELGKIAASYFDAIIIRCDKNLRGRTADDILNLLEEGVRTVNKEIPVSVIADETAALNHSYESCAEGALVTVMCDSVTGTLAKIKSLKEKEEEQRKTATVNFIP